MKGWVRAITIPDSLQIQPVEIIFEVESKTQKQAQHRVNRDASNVKSNKQIAVTW